MQGEIYKNILLYFISLLWFVIVMMPFLWLNKLNCELDDISIPRLDGKVKRIFILNVYKLW